MSLQVNLSAVQANDLLLNVAVTYQGAPLDLAGYTPAAYLKASAATPDDDATVFAIGTGLTYTYETYGQFAWAIPRADVATAGTLWYRIDVEDGGGLIATALYGTLSLVAA